MIIFYNKDILKVPILKREFTLECIQNSFFKPYDFESL